MSGKSTVTIEELFPLFNEFGWFSFCHVNSNATEVNSTDQISTEVRVLFIFKLSFVKSFSA